jgi:N-acetylneuraminic acid mutarotase
MGTGGEMGGNGSWQMLTAGPARMFHAAAAHAGKMYVFGGMSAVGGVALGDLQVFDPATGWSALAPTGTLPNARWSSTLTPLTSGGAEKLYLFGGNNGHLNGVSADLYVYDSSAGSGGTWTMLAPTGTGPSPRSSHSAVVIQNRMYVFGGEDSVNSNHNDLYVYDPSTSASGSWTALSPTGTVPMVRFDHAAAAVSDKMYIYGGAPGYLGDFFVYDPAVGAPQGAWTKLAPSGTPPSGRSGASAATLNSVMYLFAGAPTYSRDLADLWSYDPATNRWTPLQPTGDVPTPRDGGTMVSMSSALFAFGGEVVGASAPLGDMFRYSP